MGRVDLVSAKRRPRPSVRALHRQPGSLCQLAGPQWRPPREHALRTAGAGTGCGRAAERRPGSWQEARARKGNPQAQQLEVAKARGLVTLTAGNCEASAGAGRSWAGLFVIENTGNTGSEAEAAPPLGPLLRKVPLGPPHPPGCHTGAQTGGERGPASGFRSGPVASGTLTEAPDAFPLLEESSSQQGCVLLPESVGVQGSEPELGCQAVLTGLEVVRCPGV